MARFDRGTGSRTWNKVKSQQLKRIERETVIDPIPTLFVCVLPGRAPLNLAAAHG
jgi:hypothetical protein